MTSYLSRLPGARAVLQIIHVSDLHVLATKHPAARTVGVAQRWAQRLGLTGLSRKLQEGTAPSDPFAPIVFRHFVEQITVKDPTWSKCPTWVIDTGDQTTYGDQASFVLAQQYIASFAAAGATPSSGALCNVHGNHDAWPEDLPIFAGAGIPVHTAAMHAPPFAYSVGRAQAPLRAPLATNGEIQLFTLDTVNDGAWENFWARGHVDDPQLQQLDGLIGAQHGPDDAVHLRILATHHPVHFPPPSPAYEMVIANASDVGPRIPFVHLVLSGHTHALYPAHGSLPHSARACPHAPLGTDQCQLVVGTLMQEDPLRKRGAHPHQCQVLRFHQDPAQPELVVVQRLLASRNPSATPCRIDYDFVPIAGGSRLDEELVVAL